MRNGLRTGALVVVLSTARTGFAVNPDSRWHSGFFARSETGVALFWEQIPNDPQRARRSNTRGVGQSTALSIGGTPWRGLVLGGTAWTTRFDPVFIEHGQTVTPDDDSVKVTFVRLGPFVDFYPDPATGYHAQVALSFTAHVESDVKGNAIRPAALGAAVTTGCGYEWFVADELSLGILGRLTTGTSLRSTSEGLQRRLWSIPELALTVSYH